ncbi:MAG: translocation/assembly module TamB [Rikenellaceae bacterium]|nr:translocation/assembly module TamB [Rikenellaceae bacterium]
MLSAHITAKGSGNQMDNVNGTVDIDEVVYISPTDTIRTGLVRLTGVNNERGKMLALQSSFADLQFTSRLGYADLFTYLQSALREYIPTLGTGQRPVPRLAATANAGNFYLLTMKVKEANNVAGAIVPGLIIAQGTELSFMLNPRSENLSLSLRSEYLEWGRFFVSNLDVNSRNQGDSLSIFMRAQDLFASGFYMPGLSVIGGVKDDKVRVSTRFADTENGVSAIVTGEALFRSTPAGLRQIVMRLGQSYITNKEQTWRLSSGQIVYDTTRISVERLRIVSSNGELVAQGVASRSRQDTLRVRLSNFTLGPMAQFTSRMGYTVSGITNGYADMVSAMKDGMIFSNITFDSLKVNNIQAPPLLFDTRWDLASERARVVLTDRAKADTLVQFFYRPKDKRYLGNVKIKGLDLSLIDPLLEGVLRNSSGRADIALRMTSAEGSPVFNGSVRIPQLTTTIDFTNVPYTLSDATVTVKDNTFTLPSTALRDPEGNRADLDAQFALSKGFSNYSYTIGVRPRDFLVLSTTPQQNELFNGRVHASGAATIRGNKRGVTMGITATTAANSTFQMSLSSKSGIGEADFITFVDKKVTVDSSYYEKRKRLLMAAQGKSSKENSSSLAIDMALQVLPNTEFSLVVDPTMGKGIKARGNGSLNINVNPKNGEFRMYGDYELSDGSYNLNLEQLVDRTFSINPGSVIRWTGDPADALLDVSASYDLKASLGPLVGTDSPYANTRVNTECTITLSDRLIKPNISFAVEVKDAVPEIQNIVSNALNTPEAMATQFLYLVAFNGFSSDASTGANMGSVNMGSTALNMLTSQFNNMLSSKNTSIGLNVRLAGETTSTEFGIDISQSINERVFLDIEGNYDMDDNAAAKVNANSSNLTGDFALRYLVDRAGNLQGKIFSRTINTYDENQGLQETGVGIYYHEDFNSVGDIRRNIRERFARNKFRKAQEAAEQAAQQAKIQNDTIPDDTIRTDTIQRDTTIVNNNQKP